MRDVSQLKIEYLKNKVIAVLGFGSQGLAQSLNLRDSGLEVIIGLRNGSNSVSKAKNEGFDVMEPAIASKKSDVILVALPDEVHAQVFAEDIKPNFKRGNTVIVIHGLSFHFGYVSDFEEYNIGMVAPKAVGPAVRKNFIDKTGIFSLISKFHCINEEIDFILPEFAKVIGSKKILETTFKEECETDLFGEQVVICGGVISLFSKAFDVLVENGYSHEIAYFECIHELKLIMDLVHERGIDGMFSSISNTAKYGGLKVGDFIIDDTVKERMRKSLSEIQNGNFANKFINAMHAKEEIFGKEVQDRYKTSKLGIAGDNVINILKKSQ